MKTAANKIADKVNAQGETSEARLDAVDGRIDQAVIQGVHLGASLGLAAMTSQTNEDYSSQPVGFVGGRPDEVDDIDEWRPTTIMLLPLPKSQTPNPSSTSYLKSSLY